LIKISRRGPFERLDKFISARVSRSSIIDHEFDLDSVFKPISEAVRLGRRGGRFKVRGNRKQFSKRSRKETTFSKHPTRRGIRGKLRIVFPAALRKVLVQVSSKRALGFALSHGKVYLL